MYDIQDRWKLEGSVLQYYGLRNSPNMFKNSVRLTKKQLPIIQKMPCDITPDEISVLGELIGVQIVKAEDKKVTPPSISEARF